jgi:hypothetical protein
VITTRSLERLAGALALFCLAMAALLLGKPSFTNASRPPRGISDPAVAIQVARSMGEVDHILGEAPSPDREVMRFKERIDFVFIGAYTGLFLTLGWLLMRGGGWGWFAGPAAMICAAGTAAFDVMENFAILRILDVPLYRMGPQMITAIRSASAAKWDLAGLTLALLSSYFFRSSRWGVRIIGGLFLLSAAMDFYGLRDNRFLVWQGLPAVAGMVGIVVFLLGVARGGRNRVKRMALDQN